MPKIEVKIVRRISQIQAKKLYLAAGWWEEADDRQGDMIAKLVKATFCFAAAYCGQELIGLGRAISDGVSDAYIQDVVVASKYRGRKVGSRIVQKLLDHLQDRGLGWIGLIAQPGTETFYRNLGFRRLAGHVAMRYRH